MRVLRVIGVLAIVGCSADDISAPPSALNYGKSSTLPHLQINSRLGTNAQSAGTISYLVDSLAAANIGWMRNHSIWGEPSATSDVVTMAQLAAGHGMSVLGGVGGEVPLSYRVSPTCELPSMTYVSQWRAFIDSAVTAQAAAGVRYFSVGNEPESKGCGSGWINYYWPALVQAADVIHSKDPSYKVVGFELGAVGTDPGTLQTINDLMYLNPGIVDVFAVHIYQPAYYIVATMNGDVATYITNVPEVWLTEYGYAQPNQTDLFDRNELAHFLQFWLQPEYITNPRWTKSFNYNMASDPSHGHLFNCDASWNCTPTVGYYALRYLQDRLADVTYGVGYRAWSHAYQDWYWDHDGGVVPPGAIGYNTEGVWGMQMDFAPPLRKAGVRLCAKYHVGNVGWTGDFCDGEWVGEFSFPWVTLPTPFEAFKIRMEDPLPQRTPTVTPVPMYLCGYAVSASPVNFPRSSCSSGATSGVIGTTGQANPILRFYLRLIGDIR